MAEISSRRRKDDIKVYAAVLESPEARSRTPASGTVICALPQRNAQQLQSSAANSKVHLQTNSVPKTELGGWTSVKSEKATFASNMPIMKHGQKDVLSNRKVLSPGQRASSSYSWHSQQVRVDERSCRLAIESDEEIDSGFPCLLDDRETGKTNFYSLWNDKYPSAATSWEVNGSITRFTKAFGTKIKSISST
ncbi:uncharacterized protein LOC108953875 [Eucalyptus grandis]|uniref:uncharacterized protein LOC108953875 n=1 Tax=Eucalyptus grandis TaxID=71139 RepID=UPI00192EBD28|nr:uncharacterized protein LOC108953875 [Eucalyptus grandis]